MNEVWRGGWGGPDVKGRVVFDLLYAYKRTQFTELESYRLDAVGEQELGVGKERYTGDSVTSGEVAEQLLESLQRDVELCSNSTANRKTASGMRYRLHYPRTELRDETVTR